MTLNGGLNAGSLPGGAATGAWGIAPGPDGNIWFTDDGTTKAIGRINTSNGTIREFSVGLQSSSKPKGIASGPDGNLWFGDESGINEIQTVKIEGGPTGGP